MIGIWWMVIVTTGLWPKPHKQLLRNTTTGALELPCWGDLVWWRCAQSSVSSHCHWRPSQALTALWIAVIRDLCCISEPELQCFASFMPCPTLMSSGKLKMTSGRAELSPGLPLLGFASFSLSTCVGVGISYRKYFICPFFLDRLSSEQLSLWAHVGYFTSSTALWLGEQETISTLSLPRGLGQPLPALLMKGKSGGAKFPFKAQSHLQNKCFVQ